MILRTLITSIVAIALMGGLAAPVAAAPAEPVIETVAQFAASDCWLATSLLEEGTGDLRVYGQKECNVSTTGSLKVSLYGPYNGNFLGSTTNNNTRGWFESASFTRYCNDSSYQYLYSVAVRFSDSAGRSIVRTTGHYRTVSC